jgi:hypothetical protein
VYVLILRELTVGAELLGIHNSLTSWSRVQHVKLLVAHIDFKFAIFWNPNAFLSVHKIPPLFLIPSQMNPVYTLFV